MKASVLMLKRQLAVPTTMLNKYGIKPRAWVLLEETDKGVLIRSMNEEYFNSFNPSIDHLIAIKKIVATLPSILSNRYEGAILPIELANGVASLSTYPSAKALELFASSFR